MTFFRLFHSPLVSFTLKKVITWSTSLSTDDQSCCNSNFSKGKLIFCMRWMFQCRTLLYNVSWIVSCLKGRYSTNLQTNCEAPYPTALIRHTIVKFVITWSLFWITWMKTTVLACYGLEKGHLNNIAHFVWENVLLEKKNSSNNNLQGLILSTIQYCHWIIGVLGIFFPLHYYGLEILW